MTNVKPIVGIIGTGNIGVALATNLAKGGRPFLIADRNPAKASALADSLGELATPKDIPSVIKDADIIIFAIWFDAIKEVIGSFSNELLGKMIIDPSNPIAPDEKGGFKKIIDAADSAGQQISAMLPAGTKLVKAFGTLGAISLANAAFQIPELNVLFYATDSRDDVESIEQLIRDSGFEPLSVGGTDQSIRIEVFGDLHEFGAIGKPVTVSEATQKI